MYQDVNGKKGYRALQGHSGKVYGNMRLLSQAEISEALADGIVDIPDPQPPAPEPEALERRRRRRIRAETQNRVIHHLFGDANDGEMREALTVIEIIDALTGLAVDLVQAGVLTQPQINQRLVDLRAKAVDMRQARQAAADAISGGTPVDTFIEILDGIIPSP